MPWEWKAGPIGNLIWDSPDDRIFISYNPTCSDTGKPETCIVVKDGKSGIFGRQFMAMTGDWRAEYEAAYERDGMGGVLAFYETKHAEHLTWPEQLIKLLTKED